jgi:hypothetical protein
VDRVIERDTPEAKLEGLRKEFSEYKQSQEEKIRAESERAKATAEAQAIADFQSQQKSFIASHEDDYPLISAIGGTKLLYDIVDAHFQETGNVMSHKEAADRLEQTYFDNLSKLKTSEKVAKKLGIVVPVEKMSQVTLTNGRTGGAAPTETTGKKIWTAEEARDAALAKIRGTAAKT